MILPIIPHLKIKDMYGTYDDYIDFRLYYDTISNKVIPWGCHFLGQTRKFSSLGNQFQLSLVGLSGPHLNAQNDKLNCLNNEGTLCHV